MFRAADVIKNHCLLLLWTHRVNFHHFIYFTTYFLYVAWVSLNKPINIDTETINRRLAGNILSVFPWIEISVFCYNLHHISFPEPSWEQVSFSPGNCLLPKNTKPELTHWGGDKMDAISQTTFSNTFSWKKIYEFRLRFHWSMFLMFELIIFQHWFR